MLCYLRHTVAVFASAAWVYNEQQLEKTRVYKQQLENTKVANAKKLQK